MVLRKKRHQDLLGFTPSLTQIQNFIKYERKKIGDNMLIDHVQEYADQNAYDAETASDELFVFGLRIGDGSDDDHFNLCFSSKDLISVASKARMFHLDCTYKILKYMYPLLVFGVTNLQRQFIPVAFMITSHETTNDFTFFFEAFNTVVQNLFEHTFQPDFYTFLKI